MVALLPAVWAVLAHAVPSSAQRGVIATFETPVVAHVAPQTHAWFSQILDPGTGPLVLSMSLSGDGTTAKCPGTCAGTPGPSGCPKNHTPTSCSATYMSTDNGRSWHPFESWAGANEIVVLPGVDGGATNGTFVTLPYRVTVDLATNRSASSIGTYGRLDSTAVYTHNKSQDFVSEWTIPAESSVRWPSTLVHTGTVIRLHDGSYLTTMYGHGAGNYRSWSTHSATFFVRSTDSGRTWSLISNSSLIPWQPAYGLHADGPGEPNTARLPDGTLWCVYRSDATENLWSALSSDEGVNWHNIQPLNWSWSVRPQLRVTSKGFFVLTSGRPGIDMWVSSDRGATWTRFNIAAEHNRLLANEDPALLFDAQVVNADGPHFPRASPEPETSSYTGLVEASDGALVVSYDRLANGWKDRVWAANGTLLPGCWGDADRVFTMRVTLAMEDEK